MFIFFKPLETIQKLMDYDVIDVISIFTRVTPFMRGWRGHAAAAGFACITVA